MIRSYEALIKTADAYADSRTLVAGIELDIFTRIGRRSITASGLARQAKASPEGMTFLLNALAGMGLLNKQGGRYRNTRLSRSYLDTASPKSISNFLWLAGQHWENWIGLSDAVRKGRSRANFDLPDDPRFRKRFAKALHERSFYLTPKLIRHIHLGEAKSLLDLGGGAGSYAFSLIRKTPGLCATIFDRPPAAMVALAEARRAGLSKRVSVIGGDLFCDNYGGPYDAVFYSNVIHIYGPKENLQILKKIKMALKPGGRLIIVEYFLEKDHAHPPEVSSFALMMYLITASGNCYTWDEVRHWLRRFGFSRIRRVRATETIGILDATLKRQ
ncbi:MAG: methyltransferase [Nitrospiria bacterium]